MCDRESAPVQVMRCRKSECVRESDRVFNWYLKFYSMCICSGVGVRASSKLKKNNSFNCNLYLSRTKLCSWFVTQKLTDSCTQNLVQEKIGSGIETFSRSLSGSVLFAKLQNTNAKEHINPDAVRSRMETSEWDSLWVVKIDSFWVRHARKAT